MKILGRHGLLKSGILQLDLACRHVLVLVLLVVSKGNEARLTLA